MFIIFVVSGWFNKFKVYKNIVFMQVLICLPFDNVEMWEIWDLENQYCSQYEVNYFTDVIKNAERNWYIYIYTSKLVK